MNFTLAATISITIAISSSVRGAYINTYSTGRSGSVPKLKYVMAEVPENPWRWAQPASMIFLPAMRC